MCNYYCINWSALAGSVKSEHLLLKTELSASRVAPKRKIGDSCVSKFFISKIWSIL